MIVYERWTLGGIFLSPLNTNDGFYLSLTVRGITCSSYVKITFSSLILFLLNIIFGLFPFVELTCISYFIHLNP